MPSGLSPELKLQLESGAVSPLTALRRIRRGEHQIGPPPHRAGLRRRAAAQPRSPAPAPTAPPGLSGSAVRGNGGAAGPGATEAERCRQANVAGALAELDALVGLGSVKRVVRELQAMIQVQQQRRQHGLVCRSNALHMVFSGAPGTGKTTVARILGRLFHGMGVLSRGHVVEVERADLVGEYIGHTAQRTRETIRRALGGVLFVDEAYSLARGGEKDFGREALDGLVKGMEDYRDQLVVILAGYPVEMAWLLNHNPGLQSRFALHIRFPDYEAEELVEIAIRLLRQDDYALAPAAVSLLRQCILAQPWRFRSTAGNARAVRNLMERAIRCQALRLMAGPPAGRDDLAQLERADLESALTTGNDSAEMFT